MWIETMILRAKVRVSNRYVEVLCMKTGVFNWKVRESEGKGWGLKEIVIEKVIRIEKWLLLLLWWWWLLRWLLSSDAAATVEARWLSVHGDGEGGEWEKPREKGFCIWSALISVLGVGCGVILLV